MATPTRFRRGQTKPLLGTQIDWGHPLAFGLIGAWLFNEGGGNQFHNLVTGDTKLISANLATPTSANWANNLPGRVHRTNVAGYGARMIAPPSVGLQPVDAVSIFWRGQILGDQTGGNSPAIVAMWHNATNVAPYLSWGLLRTSTQANLQYGFNQGGSYSSWTYAGAINTGYPVGILDYLSTYDRVNLNHSLYRAGRLFGSNTWSASGAIWYGATPTLTLGTHITASETVNVDHDVAYVWNRKLTEVEAQQLHLEPYAFLQPAAPKGLWYVNALGGVTVSPSAASLVLTGLTPTVLTPVTVTPTAAALVLTGLTPTVLTPVVVAPTAAALTLTGLTPTIQTPVVVNPAALALALTGLTPTVTVGNSQVVTPGPLGLVLTGLTSTVTATDNKVVSPAPLALVLTGLVPTIGNVFYVGGPPPSISASVHSVPGGWASNQTPGGSAAHQKPGS